MGKTLAGRIKYLLGQRILKKEDLPDEEFLSLETVHAPVHIGTHLDYTFHYGTMSEGGPSKTADQIPLEWCYRDGVKLDLSHKKPADVIESDDLRSALAKINYSLKPGDIVLLRTGADKLYGSPRYFSDYPGVGISAIDFLLDHKINVFGVDTMGIDRPYRFMLAEFLKDRDIKKFYPAHFHGRKRSFVHIERLANLEKLPDHGFKVICFPIRIKNTGAAWARVVAVL
jgi:kynurenine formamidase